MTKILNQKNEREMKFSKIGTTDFYRQYNGLNGYDLLEGEQIEVKFPNGRKYITLVFQEKGRGSEQIDMNGIPDRFVTSHAYIKIWNKDLGMDTKVYLNNDSLEVRRLREPKTKEKARFWHDGKEYKYL